MRFESLVVKPDWRRHPDRTERALEAHPNREPVGRALHPARTARERTPERRRERRC